MILSDRELRAALARGALRVSPDPPAEAWSSTALDLRLASEIIRWKKPKVGGVDVPVSPFNPDPLQLEIWNVGPLDIKLEAGMPICQLIFEIVDGTPEKGYEGKFSIEGPTV